MTRKRGDEGVIEMGSVSWKEAKEMEMDGATGIG